MLLKSAVLASIFIYRIVVAQDSPLSASPGSPPPPQGWNASAPEDGGIHLPAKKKRRPYKIKLQPIDQPSPASSAAPASNAAP